MLVILVKWLPWVLKWYWLVKVLIGKDIFVFVLCYCVHMLLTCYITAQYFSCPTLASSHLLLYTICFPLNYIVKLALHYIKVPEPIAYILWKFGLLTSFFYILEFGTMSKIGKRNVFLLLWLLFTIFSIILQHRLTWFVVFICHFIWNRS